MAEEELIEIVSLAEVKSILTKIEKEREELLYEQRIALEHAHKFAKLNVTNTKKLINDLKKMEAIDEHQAYKIADILPKTEDDVKTLFAKERMTLSDKDAKQIISIVAEYLEK
jgi:DNA-directed RNA polymerase subunit F